MGSLWKPAFGPYIAVAVAVVFAVLLGWALRLDSLLTDARKDLKAATTLVANIVEAVKAASDNDQVTEKTVVGQVVAMGESNRALKVAISENNEKLEAMAAEAVRLKANAKRMRELADQAEAQRASALRKLSDLRLPPDTRRGCTELVDEANRVLDMLREQGL